MLQRYSKIILTPTDASIFLLKNRKELDGYISSTARDRSVDLLTELLIQWSGSPPESIAIDFENLSLTPDNKIHFPWSGFQEIRIADPMQLLRQRKGRRFTSPFTLFQEGKIFYVAFTLKPKIANKNRTHISSNTIRIAHQNGYSTYKSRTQKSFAHPPKEPKQKILFSKYGNLFSGGFRSMNWDGLSGWGVSGGLPSLGKKSR